MQDAFLSTGRFSTAKGRAYMTQLCKHFGHKVPAEVDGDRGHVAFPLGMARMQADDHALIVELTAADAETVQRLQGVIDSHLERFAFREEFRSMDWTAPAPNADQSNSV